MSTVPSWHEQEWHVGTWVDYGIGYRTLSHYGKLVATQRHDGYTVIWERNMDRVLIDLLFAAAQVEGL